MNALQLTNTIYRFPNASVWVQDGYLCYRAVCAAVVHHTNGDVAIIVGSKHSSVASTLTAPEEKPPAAVTTKKLKPKQQRA